MSTPSPLEVRLRAKVEQLRADAEAYKRQAEIEISAMLQAAAAIEAELDAAEQALAPDDAAAAAPPA